MGLALAHFDVLYRLINRQFEWFEIYIAPLMSIYLLTLFYLCLLPVLAILLAATKKSVKAADLNLLYGSITTLVLSLFIIHIPIQMLLAKHYKFYATPRIEISFLVSALIVLVFIMILRKGATQSKSIQNRVSESKLAAIINNYVFIWLAFIATCFVIDVWEIRSLPARTGIPGSLQEKPNIVIVTLDTVRADHLSYAGYPKKTSPVLDEIAAQGVVFNNAHATSSWTLPSHASLFTGKYIYEHKAHMAHQLLDAKFDTLAEILQEKGYNTAGFVGGPYCKAKYGVGQGFSTFKDRLDFFEYSNTIDDLGLRRLLDFLSRDLRQTLLGSDGERSAAEINGDVFRWLDRNKNSRFLLFLNYFDAHYPHNLGLEYLKDFTSDSISASDMADFRDQLMWYRNEYRFPTNVDQRLLEYSIARYDAEIRYLDREIGRLLDKFRNLGIIDNTLFVFVSDHGEEFLEHGGISHQTTLFDEVLRIPLIFYYPAALKTARRSELVGIQDLFPTVLELAGFKAPGNTDAVSLIPVLRGESTKTRDLHIAERYRRDRWDESGLLAAMDGRWKLIESAPVRETIPFGLFDHKNDRGEQTNLHGKTTRPALQSALDQLAGKSGVAPALREN